MLRKGNPPIPLVGTETGTASTENSVEGPQKTIVAIQSCNPIPGQISREKHGLKGYMHPNINYSAVHNSQDVETN